MTISSLKTDTLLSEIRCIQFSQEENHLNYFNMKNLIYKAAPIFIMAFFLMSMQSQTGISKYSGNITQAGTAAPTVVVQDNDFLATLVWTRSGVGVYVLTASYPIFTAGKTRAWINAVAAHVAAVITSTTVLTFTVKSDAGAAADVLLTDSPFQVEVKL